MRASNTEKTTPESASEATSGATVTSFSSQARLGQHSVAPKVRATRPEPQKRQKSPPKPLKFKTSEANSIYFGQQWTEMQFLHTVENNSMSQRYISCDGHNISYTSSGFRLIMTLITSLMNESCNTFFIDEPELGISPEAQGILADFLFDRAHRNKYFPHVKTLVLATHSSIFLDRKNIRNNYAVQKLGDNISITRVTSQSEFNQIHFFLLGNRFETLYLPSLIFIVEGKTDQLFIQRVLSIKYPDQQFSVINATSDGRIKDIIFIAKNLLTDLQRSPYRDRIIPILDLVHGPGIKQNLIEQGVPEDSIVVWSKNGIEFVYPPSLIDKIYGEGGTLVINDDLVERNGITQSKVVLAEKVASLMTDATEMHHEFQTRLLDLINRRIGI